MPGESVLQVDTPPEPEPAAPPAEPAVPPLAGWTVAVTAARRADELLALLERRGARVVHGPSIRIIPLPDDAELLAATRACLAAPVDLAVATTGIGFRGWIEAAEGWGLGDALREQLSTAHVLARGPKARGAVRAAGLVDAWSPASESSSEVLEHLLAMDLEGKRVVVQLHGEPLPDFVDALEGAGADVVQVPVYRWVSPEDTAPMERLLDQLLARQVDAVTFTSAPAAVSLLRLAETRGDEDKLLDVLRKDVLVACVGPVTAGPLERRDVPTAQPTRARLGALARTVVDCLPARSARLDVAGHELDVRGHAVVVDGRVVPLPPVPMALLRALARYPGRVLSRADLLRAIARSTGGSAVGIDEHAVESAVTRLRSALGDSRCIQTVVKRGYRLAYDPPHLRDACEDEEDR
ncbi:uroporphyrinogen-III synthase [Motilibacter aurantiacus]|uniref:uroporphyrinogen-III synthase n=1 Tax=Motilibacter aurantiacus TaxID=2714955 RepID=UPI001407E615|nr:uroporphyrinogen-III synthase [Motilibacter aurantiacus]NHC43650.1 uroporphyrinogen-III synthase [Motilibacter aurantiacus]